MRTKTLLLSAAALLAGLLSTQAQNVYSANIVGYANSVLPVGYSSLVVPLNATNSGTTVPARQVLTAMQGGDSILLWNGGGYSTYTYLNGGPGLTWQYPDGSFSDTDPNLSLGGGFFFQNGQAAPETNTFVGTVTLTNSVSLPVGYSLVGSTVPVGGALTNSAFNLPLQGGDSILLWNGGGYSTYTFLNGGPGLTWQYPDGSFSDTPPSVGVGGGFFYQNGQAATETWQQNYVVQ